MSKFSKRLFILSFCFLFLIASTAWAEGTTDLDKARYQEIYNLIKDYHVDNPTYAELSKGSIQGMIDALHDPYTEYFSEDEFKDFMNSIEGSYSGVGMVMSAEDGYLVVQQVFENSPASKAGIQKGDQLITVNGASAIKQQMDMVVSKIKGEEGSKVKLEFDRAGKTFAVELTRQKIEMPIVQSKLLDQQVGYIELASFSDEAVDQFAAQLNQLKAQKMKGLVIDLRDNPGGLLSAAQHLASLFIEKGPLVYVKDNKGNEQAVAITDGQAWNLPVVVLVNQNTASASEIFTSAMKDYGKATVVGTQTFGKGVVQELIPLQTGGVLKLTIEQYFAPKHEVINHIGVTPDILVSDSDEQLQAALYVLNKKNMVTFKTSGEVWINGVKEKAKVAMATKTSGKWYVSLRKLAYLFHGHLSYNAQKQEATLQIGSDVHTFALKGDKDVLLNEGTSYLLLDDIIKDYHQMHQTLNGQGDLLLNVQP